MSNVPGASGLEALAAAFAAGASRLPGANRLSDGDFEAIYALGHGLYAQQKFDEAAQHFGLLTVYRPAEPRYLRALAACRQRAGRYVEAIQSWSLLAFLAPENPDTTLHVAECQIRLGQRDEALASLRMAIRLCELAGTQGPVKMRAQALANLLEKQ